MDPRVKPIVKICYLIVKTLYDLYKNCYLLLVILGTVLLGGWSLNCLESIYVVLYPDRFGTVNVTCPKVANGRCETDWVQDHVYTVIVPAAITGLYCKWQGEVSHRGRDKQLIEEKERRIVELTDWKKKKEEEERLEKEVKRLRQVKCRENKKGKENESPDNEKHDESD